jgi:hypothetical protein
MTSQGRSRSLCVNSLCALAALVLAVMTPSMTAAGPSRVGPTFNASGNISSVTTDVAHDPGSDVYLFVSGQLGEGRSVYGRFVQGDGTILGGAPFFVSATRAYSQEPRVAYSAALGGFVVTWLDRVGDIWGRFVRFSPGGAPDFATGDFLIDRPFGGARSSTTAAVACAGAKPECLVAWHQEGDHRHGPVTADIHAVRIGLEGQRLGTKHLLTNDMRWQAGPTVGYDPAAGIYVVAHTQVLNTSALWVHRIQADTGTHLGVTVVAEAAVIYKPEIAFNPATGQFLISYYEETTNTIYGRFVKSDGTIVGGIMPLASGYNATEGNTIAYNASSGSFLGVAHGTTPEDIAFEVSAAGNPSDVFVVTDARGTGTFNPRVTAHSSRPEWMLTTSASFTYTAGQRVTTDTRDPGDPGDPDGETIDLSPGGAPNGSWFLAEGFAQNIPNGFHTFYLIANENPEPVNVRVYFSGDNGKTFSRRLTIAANSRKTLNLAEETGTIGSFGAVFQSLTPGLDIFVERSIYWGPNLEGSTAEVATKSLTHQWYFGEGSRDYFNNYFLLFNPNQVGGSATFTFFLETGGTVQREVSFGPQQRVTLDTIEVPELALQNFGVKIASTVPVVAERAMYFGFGSGSFIGGTASTGATALSASWLFAEGAAAPGFHTFYLLMNPNPFPITVFRQFFLEDGTKIQGHLTVDAGSRKTVYLNHELGDIGGAAAQFTSESPFIAERSIYWGTAGWVEGTNVMGATSAASDWHMPEGTETGEFDSFVLILNPTGAAVTVDVIVYIEDLGRFTAPFHLRPVIPAEARKTINMREFLEKMEQAAGFPPGTLSETSFSTRIKATEGQPIVVEHALYRTFDGLNRWRTGSAAFGVPR